MRFQWLATPLLCLAAAGAASGENNAPAPEAEAAVAVRRAPAAVFGLLQPRDTICGAGVCLPGRKCCIDGCVPEGANCCPTGNYCYFDGCCNNRSTIPGSTPVPPRVSDVSSSGGSSVASGTSTRFPSPTPSSFSDTACGEVSQKVLPGAGAAFRGGGGGGSSGGGGSFGGGSSSSDGSSSSGGSSSGGSGSGSACNTSVASGRTVVVGVVLGASFMVGALLL